MYVIACRYMFMCVDVCKQVYVHTCARVCGGQMLTMGVSVSIDRPPFSFLKVSP